MSMHRVINYGSFLQAYSLKSVLERMGHTVVFVDYHVGKPIVPYRKSELLKFRIKNHPLIAKPLKKLLCRLHHNRDNYVFDYLFSEEYLAMMGVSDRRTYNEKVDLLVIGSDQVFSCLQPDAHIGYSKELFGQYKHAKSIVSYAGSFGHTTYEELCELNIDRQIAHWMKSFDHISVRDTNSPQLLARLGVEGVVKHIDPVFLSDYDQLTCREVPYDNYVIVYTYTSREYSDAEVACIRDFAHRNGKQIMMIGKHKPWSDINIHANPFEMLSYYAHADFIITDTFHGTVFSIKLNKQFVTMIREDNVEKLGDLIATFGMEARCIRDLGELQSYYERQIDFTEVNSIIDAERKRSIAYLKECGC